MKKGLRIILLIQIFILVILTINVFSRYKYLRFFFINKTSLPISFESDDAVNGFLDWLKHEKLAVIKTYAKSEKSLTMYISDLSYSSDIQLINGTIPINGQYISDTKNNDIDQCGLIKPLIKHYSTRIYEFKECMRYGVEEIYTINTTNDAILKKMQRELSGKGVSIIGKMESDSMKQSAFLTLITSYNKYQILLFMMFFLSLFFSIFSCIILQIDHIRKAKEKNDFRIGYKAILMIFMLFTNMLFVFNIPFFLKISDSYITDSHNYKLLEPLDSIYRIALNDVGAFSLSHESELFEPIERLYKYLSDKNNAFFMNAENIKSIEYFDADIPLNGLITDGFQTYIQVSPNYFNLNPIYTTNGAKVTDKIEISDNTLNVIVPEKFFVLSDKLEKELLEAFDFRKNQIYNNVFRTVDTEHKYQITTEPLKINFIYVKNDQSYYTYSPMISKENENSIIDPVVVVDTNNTHPSNILNAMTTCFYFEYNNELPVNDYLRSLTGIDNFVYAISISREEKKNVDNLRNNLLYCLLTLIALGYAYSVLLIILNNNLFLNSCKKTSIKTYITRITVLMMPSILSIIICKAVLVGVLRRFNMSLSAKNIAFIAVAFLLQVILLEKPGKRRFCPPGFSE